MRFMKKAIFLLICVMVVAVVSITVFAANGETNLSYDITDTQVEIDGEITLTLSIGDMTASAFKGGFYFDNTKLEVSKITWSNITCYSEEEEDDVDTAPMSKTTKKKANTDGSALGVYLFNMGTDSECYECTFVTVTFKAIANGEATITLREETTGTDAFKSDSVETITITIGGSAPACDHGDWGVIPSYTANNDGTHNVKYTCENCGVEVAEESKNIPCFDDRDSDGICDACNAKIPCEHEYKYDCDKVCAKCGEETRPEAKHEYTYACDAHCAICHELTNEDAAHNIIHVGAVDATCDENGNIEYWYCEICGSAWADEGLTQVTNLKSVILPAGHSFLNGIRGTQLSAGDCVTPATYATKCDRCDVEDETKVITGEMNPANHAGEKFFEDTFEDMSQHLVYCNKCGELWDSQNPSAPHEANEEGYCECGLFAVVQDFNGGQISTKPPYPEMTEEAWTDMVESQLGGFDVTSMSRFTFGLSILVEDENIAMMNLMFVKEGYKLVGLAYDAEGTQRYNGENIEKPTTLYYVWEPLHTHAHDHYDITETTHQSICSCGEILGEAEEHDYTHEVEYYEGAIPGTHMVVNRCVCGEYEILGEDCKNDDGDDKCDTCGTHFCTLVLMPGKTPTCTEDGWDIYYQCSSCGACYGTDGDPNHIWHIEDFENWKQGEGKLAATGHSGYYSFEFYVDGSFCTVEMSFYCTTCEKIVGDPMAYNDEGMQYAGAFCNRTGVLVKTFLFEAALPENCSWDNFELKGELPETPNFNNIWNEEIATLIYGWATPLDPNNHWSREVSYQDITDEQHTVYHPCCEATETVDHTFDETTHMCACGKVEEFTLEIYVEATNEYVYLTVPYGANLLEVLEKAAEEHKIPALGEKVRVNDADYNGYNIPSYYDHQLPNNDWVDIDENSTMPANDFSVMQNTDFYGWEFSYHGKEYVGAQYYDEYFGCITEAGWRYIEENFDDVEGGAWYYFSEIEIVEGNYRYSLFVRAEGLSRVPYPTAPINGIIYAPNAEDLAYAANKGREFIDATEAWFVFGEDGKFQFDMTEIMDGKYVENGMIAWHPGFVTVGGELYYFVGDKENGGNIWANGDVIVSRLNGAEGFVNNGTYNFVDGRLNKQNGIFPSANGKQLYYYINGHKQVKLGLTKLGEGKYIYVRSNGELAVGEYYIPANGLGVVSTLYTFDANGYMVNPKYTNVNGIVDGYYYVNGKIDYGAGLINIDGDIYYVRSSGKVATGEYYITNTNGMPGFQKGMKLTFGADGKLLTKTTDFGSVINGYYYVGGKIAYGAGVVKMEDENGVFYIYVKSNGQLATGKYWPTTLNGELAAGEYDWGTDGKYYPGN